MNLVSFLLSLMVALTTTLLPYAIKNPIPQEIQRFKSETTRMFVILIENKENGEIVYMDGAKEVVVAEVVKPAKYARSSSSAFWAAHYIGAQNGTKGGIAATGVNTIKIRCGPGRVYDPAKPNNWLTTELSIIPFTELEKATDENIVVSSPGGYDIFNRYSPYVGNPVYALDKNKYVPIDEYFSASTRQAPEKILIDVRRPTQHISYIEFENWIEGDTVKGQLMDECGGVYIQSGGERIQIGKVLQRVEATGRFAGSEYSETGQVRENNPALLELSTTNWRGPVEDENLRGGIQIISANNAKYLHYNLDFSNIIGGAPYMIVGPMSSRPEDLNNPDYIDTDGLLIEPLEALPPIFSSYIRTYFDQDDYENSFRYYISEDFGRSWRTTSEITGVPAEGETSPIHYWTNIRLMLGR